jgi:hypothetical protein
MIEITDCLGRTRSPEKIYEDGSWNCPFCCAAVMAGSVEHAERRCPNPACVARGDYPPERARQEIEETERRERELAEWTERQRWARVYADERRHEEGARLDAVLVEAAARGACVRCAVESARYGRKPKFTRHRISCPRNKKLAGA